MLMSRVGLLDLLWLCCGCGWTCYLLLLCWLCAVLRKLSKAVISFVACLFVADGVCHFV